VKYLRGGGEEGEEESFFFFFFSVPTALQRPRESTFYPEFCCVLESARVSFVCPFGQTNMKIKSMEHWCLEGNLHQRHVVHRKSHMDWPEIEPGP
jgi:hypothetical protein